MDESAEELVNKVFDELFDRVLNASSLEHRDLEDTTLGKPAGQPAMTRGVSRASPVFAASHLSHPSSIAWQHQRVPKIIAHGLPQQKVSQKIEQPELVVPEVVTPDSQAQAVTAQLARTAAAAKGNNEREQWELMAVANEAISQKQFAPALAFLMVAATLAVGVDVHGADAAAAALTATPAVDFGGILAKAAGKALGGGKAGAAAAVVQVFSLMWLRTAMNYQYRYGGDLGSSLKKLMDEGGIGRLYQGLPFALVQGPLSRFGDTATNVGVLALFDSIPEAAGIPGPLRTAAASASAGVFRIFCTPIDTAKTAMQVEGQSGLSKLAERVGQQGPAPLYQGAIASAVATFAGNYPWFLTYNTLDGVFPPVSKEEVLKTLLRNALLGLSASCVSDTISNSLRVIKTTQQTAALGSTGPADKTIGDKSKDGITISEALKLVLETDGIKGLFGRGLKTRLLTNAIQGALFSVLWRYFQQNGGR
jgi:hypothetical protein